ncbi:MAG: CotH kinase family protein [Bacteroidales bacterium]|nr:CotH kinase family protein [Candidatus Colicola faecequi]
MKKFLYIFLLLLPLAARALDVPAGKLYFDNTLTGYSRVQFLVGSYTSPVSYVFDMSFDGRKWSCDIPNTISGMERYIFAPSNLSVGMHQRTLERLKDSISNTLHLNRTATNTSLITSGYIFVPYSGDNWAQGEWKSLSAWESDRRTGVAAVSGTLPVLYINTANGSEITSKEEYIDATWYLDSLSRSEYRSYGRPDSMLPMQIRGRGNYTWRDFDKKPFRIKLADGKKLLGMHKSKHWALMAAADDNLGYLRNAVGHMVSRSVGMTWTPEMKPVEVVLNGRYWGLYFLTETVRIDDKRIDITEQSDNITYPDSITGGWLVEIDNYATDGNITLREGNGKTVMITIKDPEILSTQQRNYITAQMNSLNTAIYSSSAALSSVLDIDEAARYYLVQEVLEDTESYHGSCFLYKDMDADGRSSKWTFGPVWDFGNSYWRHGERYIYDRPSFDLYWIGQIATHQCFQDSLSIHWHAFYHEGQQQVREEMEDFVDEIRDAAKNDAARWKNTSNYRDNSDMSARYADFLDRFNWRIQWLYRQWGEGNPGDGSSVENVETAQPQKIWRDGQLYILKSGRLYSLTGILVE